ncbi:MBL fold metallo-hydrolase [Streptomyces sp. NPDC013457]|uniref:MBL fold metallo-hydrolase n=1 Tax=Streptomyces sp. NPDC013457 TaxID=3364866 RepID=UPI0036F8C682
MGQACLWRDDEGSTLIDAGSADSAHEIETVVREVGLDPARIRRIVLTHGHLAVDPVRRGHGDPVTRDTARQLTEAAG